MVKVHKESNRPIIIGFIVAAILVLVVSTFFGCNELTNYPKLALVNQNLERLKPNTELSLKEAAKYQMIVGDSRPEVIQKVKNRGGNFVSLFTTMPTNVWPPTSWQTWMEADTLWNIERLKQFYVMKNQELGVDWLYKNTDGSYIERWNKLECNWSNKCPVGKYGTSDGLTYVQWLSIIAIPQISNSNKFKDSYHGFNFDVLESCSNWDNAFQNVDINNDGTDDNYHSNCSSWPDAFKVATHKGTETFLSSVLGNLDPQCIVIVGQERIGSASRYKINGIKLENWLRQNGSSDDWWDWWHGSGMRQGTSFASTPGYSRAEEVCARYGSSAAYDKAQGWDLSVIQAIALKNAPNSLNENRKFARLALATSMLGDGYCAIQYDDYSYLLVPEMTEWKMNMPAVTDMYEKNFLACRQFIRSSDEKLVTIIVDPLKQEAFLYEGAY